MDVRPRGYRARITSPTPSARPRGRDQIRAALIASTLDLLETHGLDISIRQIAEKADVPHSVIGRYFGSKDELIRSSIDSTLPADRDVAEQFVSAEQAVRAAFESAFERPERIRILAQLLQEGMDPRDIRSEAPMMKALVKLLQEQEPTHADPQIIAATVFAVSFGLVLTEDYIVDHAGLDVLD